LAGFSRLFVCHRLRAGGCRCAEFRGSAGFSRSSRFCLQASTWRGKVKRPACRRLKAVQEARLKPGLASCMETRRPPAERRWQTKCRLKAGKRHPLSIQFRRASQKTRFRRPCAGGATTDRLPSSCSSLALRRACPACPGGSHDSAPKRTALRRAVGGSCRVAASAEASSTESETLRCLASASWRSASTRRTRPTEAQWGARAWSFDVENRACAHGDSH
jgi:hypothetical protein